MRIKPTMRLHLAPYPSSKNLKKKCWQGCEEKRFSNSLLHSFSNFIYFGCKDKYTCERGIFQFWSVGVLSEGFTIDPNACSCIPLFKESFCYIHVCVNKILHFYEYYQILFFILKFFSRLINAFLGSFCMPLLNSSMNSQEPKNTFINTFLFIWVHNYIANITVLSLFTKCLYSI